jgi:VWFA-related protein
MTSARRLVLGLVGVGWGLSVLLASRTRADEAPADAEVARAIAKGLAYLKEQQSGRGHWSYSFSQDHTLGITALAGLALLENGVGTDDPAVGKAREVVRTLSVLSNQTYDLAVAILFLARSQEGRSGANDRLIQRLARRLAAGEQGGMWNYTVPQVNEEESPGSERLREDEGTAGSRRRTKPLRRRPSAAVGDNSNTQFALLGIWGGGRHGFDSNDALEAIDAHFRESQNPNGRWGYKPGAGGSPAMTCAGLMGLAIAAARPSQAARLNARARGAALAADPAFKDALQAVTKDALRIDRRSDIYYLWSLERVSVALGLRSLDGFDWYAAGARVLLDLQEADGSWPDGQWGKLPNTCLALLFLRKANLAFELDRVLRLPGQSPSPAARDPAASAQPEPPGAANASDSGDAKVTVTGASEEGFPEIAVQFEVQRPDGSYLLDAQRSDFRVTEDGQDVPISSFQAPLATEALPTTVVLVVDRSLSMEEEDRIGGLKRAVATFLKALPRGSRVAVVAFGSDVKLLCPFTEDARQVQEAVDGLSPAGATRYYDAVAQALELVGKEGGRRAVLALTDGEDTFSQSATLDSVIVAARRLGLPVHTLGLGSEDEIESEALRRLAASTRGQYYPARQADQLRTIYEQLAERLRSSYSLVYRSERRLPDGTLRPVRVFYRASRQAGETSVFVPGMVVPAAGWPRLFLALVTALAVLALLPSRLAAKRRTTGAP